LSGDDLQQAGFARAVAADEADFFTGRDGERDGFQEALVAVGEGEVVGGEERDKGS
jgi:hypothetical protein